MEIKKIIRIHIHGGALWDVSGVPDGFIIRVRDDDVSPRYSTFEK